ncbi:DarT ssDNA thymidine ADP-ribosyltransferase family protein [Pseudomonas oryzihabitans]|uniref:DarT ssDNA thymidine ADP-ribosyltransferase family protein n=1 Tax=Pseudomonas oryzihabitans TaxID=47885 RepID=UPI0005AAC9C2|nr:DarT ssDNA thymidine ADP-ribosyltransferase family protein [Pseudomonas oryzihabitans]NMZ47049.1 DUF4433 domain-containing protein [Pseudomonas oryzihabitans]
MLKKDVQNYAETLQVPFLVHFTRAQNLDRIMRHGLCPSSELKRLGIVPDCNDELKLDGRGGGISTSIAFPNCKMFYKYRESCPGTDWAVIVLKNSILWSKDCAFFRHNAADALMSRLDIDDLKSLSAFEKMYESVDWLDSRDDQCLLPYDPTDVQAEVMFFETIGPELILGAAFESFPVMKKYEHLFAGKKVRVDGVKKKFFASRGYVRKY